MTRDTITEETKRYSRRRMVATIGAVGMSSGFSGCLGSITGNSSSDGSNTETNGSDRGEFEISRTKKGISVKLAENTDIEKVNLIDPSSEALREKTIANGAQSVSFQLLKPRGSGYDAGTYQVIGVHNGNTITETSVKLEPEVKLVSVFKAEDRPDLGWDKEYKYWKDLGGVELKNAGTGPDYIKKIHTKAPPRDAYRRESFSFGGGLDSGQFIAPGESLIIKQQKAPLFLGQESVFCRRKTPFSREMELTVRCRMSQNPTWSQKYRYTQKGETGRCKYETVED